jgi:hypothetical protein
LVVYTLHTSQPWVKKQCSSQSLKRGSRGYLGGLRGLLAFQKRPEIGAVLVLVTGKRGPRATLEALFCCGFWLVGAAPIANLLFPKINSFSETPMPLESPGPPLSFHYNT